MKLNEMKIEWELNLNEEKAANGMKFNWLKFELNAISLFSLIDWCWNELLPQWMVIPGWKERLSGERITTAVNETQSSGN